MTLKNAIRRLFGRNDTSVTFSPSPLRNKPGQMAWIVGIDCEDNGSERLNGRAVRTVCYRPDDGVWTILPQQTVRIVKATDYRSGRGVVHVRAGDVITVNGIADANLEPWKEDGVTDEEVRKLYSGRELVNIVKERL